METVTAFDGWIRRGPLGPGYPRGVRAAAVARLVRRGRWPVRLWRRRRRRVSPGILTACDIMARNLVTLRPEMSIMDAIGVTLRKRISGAPVIEDGRVVGQVSRRDVLRGIERLRDERLHLPRPESPTRTQPSLYQSATDTDGSVIVNRIKRGG